MASILTNTSAMVALQSLKATNKGMGQIQNQISTGMKVATAKDNAATWAIASTMRSDSSGFGQIKEGLATALAAVNVGRNATESITDLLTEMRSKIASAGTVGADTTKIQTDINNLRSQITSIVDAASFNGVNFVNSGNSANVLTSIDRTNGTVATDDKYMTVAGYNLGAGSAGTAPAALAGSTGVITGDTRATAGLDNGTGTGNIVLTDNGWAAGAKLEVSVGGKTASYTVTQADVDATSTHAVIAVKMKAAIENLGVAGLTVGYDTTNPGTLVVTNASANDYTMQTSTYGVDAGGLSTLNGISVNDETNRTAALATVDAALDTVINAAAALGSSQKRLEIQQDFIGKLNDSVKEGIGAMVDADMEEASARLQALQVQQQLGIQSLSIANQAPQSVLSLFR